MESVIITKFEAKIGEVIFQQENLFYSVQYIVNPLKINLEIVFKKVLLKR